MEMLIIVLIMILIVMLAVGLQGLVYWGIGAFVCWAFQIPFEFTFFHGLAIALVVSSVAGVINGGSKD